jgi:hypothetical protein
MTTVNGDTNRFRFSAGQIGAAQTTPPWTPLTWQDVRIPRRALVSLAAPAEPPEKWARDLLVLVSVAYLADRRAVYVDPACWQREIHIDVPVSDTTLWRGRALSTLEELLGCLSGDRWHIYVHDGIALTPSTQQPLDGGWRAEQVALFSGGIDSTAAAAHLAAQPGGTLLLVSYYTGKIKPVQDAVLTALKRHHTRDVQPAWLNSALGSRERTSKRMPEDSEHRTRGLRFIGTGVYLAAAHDLDTLMVPENGQLALNPPLSPSRAGAWSTRSVHPWVLHLINRLINEVGGQVQVVNPLADKTKGQVSRLALDSGLTKDELLLTNSCSRPTTYMGDNVMHCGECFACLVRQSGLLAAGVADTTPYQHALTDEPLSATLEDNTRALSLWLAKGFSRLDLAVDLPLPNGAADQFLPVIAQGRAELASMLDAKLPPTSPLRGMVAR